MVQRQGCLRFDYFDGTDNIKRGRKRFSRDARYRDCNRNPDKEAGNGEKIYGVAPEAQVMFMRVFSDRQKQQDLLFM